MKRVVILIACILSIAIALLQFLDFMNDREFAQTELQNWEETVAVIDSSEISNIVNEVKTDRDNDGDIEREYRYYNIEYIFTASFEAWGETISFEDNGSNNGEIGLEDEIPEHAYEIPQSGDTVAVIYFPDESGTYKIGSKEDWAELGEISFGNLLMPVIFSIIGIALAIYFIRLTLRRKIKIEVNPIQNN